MFSRISLVLALFLGGCKTIAHDQEFAGGQGRSYLIVAADGMSNYGAYRFYFQKLDLKNSRFVDDSASVGFPHGGGLTGDEFEKPSDLVTTTRFGGKALPPGDYALLSRMDIFGGLNSTQNWNCFAQGAPVFHVAEGQVNIVSAGNVTSGTARDLTLLQFEVTQVLKGYPRFSAPVTMLVPIGMITFNTSDSWAGVKTCNPVDEPFQYKPRAAARS